MRSGKTQGQTLNLEKLFFLERKNQRTSILSFIVHSQRLVRKTEKSLFASFSSEKEVSFFLILHQSA